MNWTRHRTPSAPSSIVQRWYIVIKKRREWEKDGDRRLWSPHTMNIDSAMMSVLTSGHAARLGFCEVARRKRRQSSQMLQCPRRVTGSNGKPTCPESIVTVATWKVVEKLSPEVPTASFATTVRFWRSTTVGQCAERPQRVAEEETMTVKSNCRDTDE
jgi:hypothetical protein